MSPMHENQALITAIGESAFDAFPKSTFNAISATLNADTGEVIFDMDLRSNTRTMRHRVIDTLLSNVYPIFRPDQVAFTFVFSEHDDADEASAKVVPELAVV